MQDVVRVESGRYVRNCRGKQINVAFYVDKGVVSALTTFVDALKAQSPVPHVDAAFDKLCNALKSAYVTQRPAADKELNGIHYVMFINTLMSASNVASGMRSGLKDYLGPALMSNWKKLALIFNGMVG